MGVRLYGVVSLGLALAFATAARAAIPAGPFARLAAPSVTSVGPAGLGLIADWTPASARVKVTRYGLRAVPVPRRALSGACARTVSLTAAGADSTAVIGGVCSGVAYRVQVRTVTARGSSGFGRASDPVVPLPASVPFVPLVTRVLGRNRALVIGWAAPGYDGGRPVKSYQVTARSKTSAKTVTVPAASAGVTMTGLANGVSYQVTVRAVNAIGKSPPAAGRGVPGPARAPGPPAGLSAVPGEAAGTISVSWSAPADDGGAAITSYRLTWLKEVAVPAGTGVSYRPAPGAKPVTRSFSRTSAVIGGLSAAGVFYVFKVAARNAAGTSVATSYSSPVTLGTAPASAVRVLGAPILAHVRSIRSGVVTISYPSPTAVPAVLRSLRAGAVIVAGVSAATPQGLLRTVTSVRVSQSATYAIGTTLAPLAAAFRTLTADVSLGTAPAGASGRFTATAPGISVRQLPRAGVSGALGLSVDFSGAAQGDQGGLTFDVRGEVDLSPTLVFRASLLRDFIGLPDGAVMSFTSSVDVTESHSISASGDVQQHWPVGAGAGIYPPEASVKAGVYCYQTFLVQVGPVPLVLSPCVEISVTLSVTGSIGVTSSVSYQYGEEASWTSADPGHLTLTSLSLPPADNGPPSSSLLLQGDGALGFDVKPELFVYGVTGPYIDASISLDATVSPRSTPWLTLGLQLTIAAGWQLVIPALKIDVSIQAAGTASWRLYQSSGPPPPALTPLTLSPAGGTVSPGGSVRFLAPGAAGPVSWSLIGAAGDEISRSGTFTAAGPAGRVVTVVGADSLGATGRAIVTIGRQLGPVRNLAGTVSGNGRSVVLSWQPPTPVAGQRVASYLVSTSPPTQATTAPGSAASVVISGLVPGASYVASVSALTTTGYQTQPATTALASAGLAAAPVITSVAPRQGSAAGGTKLTITGAGFSAAPGATSFDLGPGQAASDVTCSSATACTAGTPPGPPGTVDVTATVGGLTSVPNPAADTFSYYLPATRWTAREAPLPPHPASQPDADFAAVGCYSASACVATGSYNDSSGHMHGLLETLSGSAWTPAEAPLPPDASLEPDLNFPAAACQSASRCIAAGGYFDASGDAQGVIDTSSGTTWTPAEAPPPSSMQGTGLASATCWRAECVAVGEVSSNGLIETLSGSTWTPSTAPVPAGGSFSFLQSVACGAPSSCAAVGQYFGSASVYLGLVDVLSGTTWTPEQAPLPAGADASQGTNLTSVACPSASFCAAVGAYGDSTGRSHGLLETMSGSAWTPLAAPLPPGAAAKPAYFFLNSVACSAPSACVAVGEYQDAKGDIQGLIETLSGSTWTATRAPLPADAQVNKGGENSVYLNSVACPAPASCVVTGGYPNSPGNADGLLDILSGTTWTASSIPLPANAVTPGYPVAADMGAVTCSAASACVAVGGYWGNSGQDHEGLLLTGPA